MNKLVVLYVKLIRAGRLDIGDVPERWRAKVKEELEG
ncbi:MAG: CD1375 family protein [Huintestinicola sp.]